MNLRAILIILIFCNTFISFADNIVFFVDCSGSVAGLSANRNINSFPKIQNEIFEYINSHTDTVTVIKFTDKCFDETSIHTRLQKPLSFYPLKGNTNFDSALYYMTNSSKSNTFDKIVFISDGLHNTGANIQVVIDKISNIDSKSKESLYFLQLDSIDYSNTLVSFFGRDSLLHLINSLTELDKIDSKCPTETISVLKEVKTDNNNSDVSDKTNISWLTISYWIILGIVILFCTIAAYYIIRLVYIPLRSMSSAALIQRAIIILYSLPEFLFKSIVSILPDKVKEFLSKNVPSYNLLDRGCVVPNNDIQKLLLEEHLTLTGKNLKYRGGEPDFSDISEYSSKLPGGLDNNIPKGSNVRQNVHLAQEKAGEIMLSDRKGRSILATHSNKNSKDVTMDDFWNWKNDPANPKVPHESIDGTSIQFVPKRFHEGFRHTGGVSMLTSIRNHFNI